MRYFLPIPAIDLGRFRQLRDALLPIFNLPCDLTLSQQAKIMSLGMGYLAKVLNGCVQGSVLHPRSGRALFANTSQKATGTTLQVLWI